MLDLVQLLEGIDPCNGIGPIITFIKAIMNIFQIAIPIMLIIWGSIDLGKAVMSSDEKEIKGATGKLIKRAIAAVVIFFIPFIVNLLMSLVAGNSEGEGAGATNFAACWNSR